MKTCMQENQQETSTTPTPKLTVRGLMTVKWYFQCSHRRIGRPMLAKAWLVNITVMQTNKRGRHNDEYKNTWSLNVSI